MRERVLDAPRVFRTRDFRKWESYFDKQTYTHVNYTLIYFFYLTNSIIQRNNFRWILPYDEKKNEKRKERRIGGEIARTEAASENRCASSLGWSCRTRDPVTRSYQHNRVSHPHLSEVHALCSARRCAHNSPSLLTLRHPLRPSTLLAFPLFHSFAPYSPIFFSTLFFPLSYVGLPDSLFLHVFSVFFPAFSLPCRSPSPFLSATPPSLRTLLS